VFIRVHPWFQSLASFLYPQQRPRVLLPDRRGTNHDDGEPVDSFPALSPPPRGFAWIRDSVWDMLAARCCRRVGLLSGGYGADELERAGAVSGCEAPADLLSRFDKAGGRRSASK